MTILFYPDPLNETSKIHKLCKEFDIKFHNNPSEHHDIHIFWSLTRSSIVPDDITLNSDKVINRGCWDITKQKVNDIFDDISIDPTTHTGECVQKLDLQALHSYHSVIRCPAEKRTETVRVRKNGKIEELTGDYIYQKFIVNREGDLYIRYRIYYAGGITHVVKIYQDHPFKTSIIKCELISKGDLYTPKQESELNDKCKNFGFDLGELDVMVLEKIPIVIDVNNIVGGGEVITLTDTDFAKDIKKSTYEYLKKYIS